MSSVSNSDRAYKSRILNFFNRQWLRFGDRAKTSLRQLQTVTVWGIQLLAYPLYLIVQTSTVIGKQLQNKTAKLLSPAEEQQTNSVGSQPTAVILNSLHPWLEGTPYQLFPLPQTRASLGGKMQFWRKQQPSSAPPKITFPTTPQPQGRFNNLSFLTKNQSSLTEHYLIQGVATYLETGKLVLVTTENYAVDLLSQTQHEQLKQRIKILLECYEQMQQPWWWRIASQPQRGRFHPLQWLSKLMIWVQSSPLAKRLNWFQESQLYFTSGYEAISQTPPFPPKSGFLDRLDRALSRWENSQLSPVVDQIRQWKTQLDQGDENNALLSLIRSAIDYFYGVKPENTLTGDANGQQSSQQGSKLLHPLNGLIEKGKALFHASDVEPDSLSIQQLIQAAMDHFFGQSYSRLTDTVAEETELSNEPWLTRADLFCENPPPPALASTSDEEKENFSLAVSRYLTDDFSQSAVLPHEMAEVESPTQEQPTVSEDSSQWWQAEAVSMGYEKHILARILEWVDRALLWLEETTLKIWKWLSSLLSR